MVQMLERGPMRRTTAEGLLCAEHFQMAYVTNDMARAKHLFERQLGIREWSPMAGPTPGGGTMEAHFAWAGTLMYELIHTTGPGSEIFMDRLAGVEDFALRHHHLGFLIHDQAQWDAMLAGASAQGWAVPWTTVNPFVTACFVAVPGFDHYHEYLLPTPAGLDYFNTVVPRN